MKNEQELRKALETLIIARDKLGIVRDSWWNTIMEIGRTKGDQAEILRLVETIEKSVERLDQLRAIASYRIETKATK